MTNIIGFWTNIYWCLNPVYIYMVAKAFQKRWDDLGLERQVGQSLAIDKNEAIYRVLCALLIVSLYQYRVGRCIQLQMVVMSKKLTILTRAAVGGEGGKT